jgi:uncharacterized membrane protein
VIDDINLMMTSLLVGSLLMGTVGLRSALAGIDIGTEMRVRGQIIRALRPVMPFVMAACLLTSGLAGWQGSSQPKQALAVIGFALCVAVFGITLTVHSPLNRMFLTWREDSLPSNAQHLFDRWNRWDSIRAVVATAALLSIALSMVR